MTTIYPFVPPMPSATTVEPELADAVELLSSGHYLVMRPAAKSVVNGVVDSPPPAYFWALGSMQPTMGRDVQKLPEGIRERESKVFFTTEVLRTKATATTGQPDQVTVDGELFEVSHLDDWQQLGAYHRVVLTKVKT